MMEGMGEIMPGRVERLSVSLGFSDRFHCTHEQALPELVKAFETPAGIIQLEAGGTAAVVLRFTQPENQPGTSRRKAGTPLPGLSTRRPAQPRPPAPSGSRRAVSGLAPP